MTQVESTRRKLIDILAEVSAETGVDVLDITGPSRRALFVEARSFFARRARAAGYKLIDIGEALGRSHTSVLAYFTDEEDEDVNKEKLRANVDKLTKDEKKELVKTIAETGTKEERDNLAALFSGVESERVADVEAHGAGGPPDKPLPAAKKEKKSFLDDL